MSIGRTPEWREQMGNLPLKRVYGSTMEDQITISNWEPISGTTAADGYRELIQYERDWSARGLPDSLIKASTDNPFDYAIGLKNGAVIYFEGVNLPPLSDFHGWIALTGVKAHTMKAVGPEGICTFPRGMDVHLTQIAWAADAPFGS
jgi:hypothetical protein